MATQVDGEPKEQEAGTVFIVKHQSGTMLANMKKRLRDSGPQSPNSQLREMDDPQGGGSMVGFGEGGEVLSLSPTLGEVRTNMVAFINSRSGGFSFFPSLSFFSSYVHFYTLYTFSYIDSFLQAAKEPKSTTNFASSFLQPKSSTFLKEVPNLASLNTETWKVFKFSAVVGMALVVGC